MKWKRSLTLMMTSQFKKVATGFMLQIVSLEQRASSVPVPESLLVVELAKVVLEVGVGEVRLKAGLCGEARSA